MANRFGRIAYGLPVMLALMPLPAAAQLAQQAKLIANPNEWSEEGNAVALSEDGNTAVVGAICGPGACPLEQAVPAGAAYLLTQENSSWTPEAAFVGTGDGGESVAISGDGNTAIIGSPVTGWNPAGGTPIGAAQVFVRSKLYGTWRQQATLVGTGNIGASFEGRSVALDYNGSTALVGGDGDDDGYGAVWVFTRSHGTWRQQAEIVANDAGGNAGQGWSVALARAGNKAIIGGPGDNNGVGATWIFERSQGVWREAAKLVGLGAIGNAGQGNSVSLSSTGRYVITGGPNDNSGVGAAWIFALNRGAWAQQAKLAPTDEIGAAFAGVSVSLSADGTTAVIGGPYDNSAKGQGSSAVGAAWIFTGAQGGVWTERQKLVATNSIGNPNEGAAVAVSGDGSTALVGGPFDDDGDQVYDGPVGAAWIYTGSAPPTRVALGSRE